MSEPNWGFIATSGNRARMKMVSEVGNRRHCIVSWRNPPSNEDRGEFDRWWIGVTGGNLVESKASTMAEAVREGEAFLGRKDN